jgi:transcriptional regulator with XRE-family HTH domain
MARQDAPTEKLKRWRNGRPFTQAARDIEGMNPQVLSLIERGLRRPGWLVAMRIERVTGIRHEEWRPDVAERRAA